MAKDPAMLWYWADWNSGTVLLSRFLKGCYMDLLHAQFNNGPLSLEEIKACLGSDFGPSWPTLQKKFKQTDKGLFFNEKLEREKEKRAAFSESRRENVNKRYQKSTHVDTYVLHKKVHMENENEDVNESFKEGGPGEGFFVNEISMELELTKIEIIGVQEFIEAVSEGKKLTVEEVRKYWKAFKIDNFKKREWYESHEKLLSHFRHSLKKQLSNGTGNFKKVPHGKGGELAGTAVIQPGKKFKGVF